MIRKLLFIFLLIFFLIFICAIWKYSGITKNKKSATVPNYKRIIITGETAKNGIFDPSLEYERDGKIGWMSYSAVNDFPKDVSIHIAKTIDNGKTWRQVGKVNVSKPGIVKYKNKEIKGIWRHEVSTLVNDFTDPDYNKRWKIFWHHYFAKPPYKGPNHRMIEYSWIAYKYAPSPIGPWSEEIPLFGAGHFPIQPFKVKYDLNSLASELKNILTYTEPAAFYNNHCLYLALQGIGIKKGRIISKVLLLSSNDHGKTWRYLGVLLDDEDAKSLGCSRLTAPSLFKVKNEIFLLATPLTKNIHYGVYVFKIKDIQKAEVERDINGKLIVYKYISPSIFTNAGQSDYDEHNIYGGIVMAQANLQDMPEVLQIFNTNEQL